MKISKWIANMAALTAIGLNFTAASLNAAWNPVVNIAGPPIAKECCQGTTGPVLTINRLNNGIGVWQGIDATEPLCTFCDQIYVSDYTFGTGWGPAVMISDNSSVILPPPFEPYRLYINQGDPDIMMNDSGYAVAVWEGALQALTPPQDDTFSVILSSTRSSDGTWSPVEIVRILDPIDFFPQNPAVAVNESGLAVTMWNEARGDGSLTYIMASFLPFGGAWTTPVQLDFAPYDSVTNIAGDVELNDNGQAVAIWQIGRNITANLAIHAATYDPLTSLWTTVVLDAAPGDTSESYPPEVAIDANGNAVAVWRQQNGAAGAIVAAYFTYGVGWGAPVTLFSDPFVSLLGPYVVMDPAGTATAIWNNNSTDEVLSSRLPFGGTWTASEVIGLGRFDPFSVQEAASVDDQGNVIVIIRNGNGFSNFLQSILRTVQGGWQPPEDIFTTLGTNAFPNIGIGSCGFALALWRSGEDDEDTFIQGADTVSLNNFLAAPVNFEGSRCCEKFASQTKCITRLNWDPVPCALFYRIYANGVLIATIPAGGNTFYIDTNEYKTNKITYTLTFVNIYGIESPGVSIIVP